MAELSYEVATSEMCGFLYVYTYFTAFCEMFCKGTDRSVFSLHFPIDGTKDTILIVVFVLDVSPSVVLFTFFFIGED